MTLLSRDVPDPDALITDRYLEALMSAHDRGAADAPSASEMDPAVRAAARRLAGHLTRVHPSFRFEERLAGRLADMAARATLAWAADGTAPGHPATEVAGLSPGGLGVLDPLDLLDPARPEEAPGHQRRPLIIGGTLASAALSIAGAAIVAWRLSRPGNDPMARAVRAARDRVDSVRLA